MSDKNDPKKETSEDNNSKNELIENGNTDQKNLIMENENLKSGLIQDNGKINNIENTDNEKQNLLSNSSKMLEKVDQFLIDQILDKTAFSKYKIYSLICLFCIFLGSGMEMYIFATIVIPIKEKYQCSEVMIGIITSALYLGIAIGSFFSGYLSEKFGRLLSINASLILHSIFHLMLGMWLNIPDLIIFRIVIGFALGIMVPLSMNIYAEYLSNKNRGLMLMLLWSYNSLAQVIQNLIAFIYIPNFEQDKIEKYILILLGFPLLATIICLILLKDSPRNLILSSKKENLQKAVEILNNLNDNKKLTEEEINQVIDEVSNSQNINISTARFKDIFSDFYLKASILLIILLLVYAASCEGVLAIIPLTLKKITELHSKKEENKQYPRDIIINQITIGLFGIISGILGGFIGNYQKIGRKNGIIIFIFITLITSIGIPYNQSLLEIFSPLSLFSSGVFGPLVQTYIVEIYPTKLRDISTGTFFMFYRVFDMITPFIYILIFYANYKAPYCVNIILCLLGLFAAYFLPFETVSKSLDNMN